MWILSYCNYNLLSTAAAGPSPFPLLAGSSLTPVAPYPTVMAKTTHSPLPTIKANSSHKKGTCAIVDWCGPLSRASLRRPPVNHYPDKTTGSPVCGTASGGDSPGGPPLPGGKILPALSSFLQIPLSPGPSLAMSHLKCTHQAHQGLRSAGGGGEWIGPYSCEGPS